MILVTVGTHSQGFDRLVRGMDQLAAELEEPVIIQWGSSTYIPQYAEHFQFTTSQRMAELSQEARIIVSHAGSGTIIAALQARKPLVLAPRLKQFDEHMDDHQQQLAKALAARGRVVVALELTVDTLRQALNQAVRQDIQLTETHQLVNALHRQLDEWHLTKIQPKPATKEA